MKLFSFSVKLFLILTWSILTADIVRSQSRNMSDITLPNSNEMMTQPSDGNSGNENTADAPEEVTEVQSDSSDNTNTDTSADNDTADAPDASTDNADTTTETDTADAPEPEVDTRADTNTGTDTADAPDASTNNADTSTDTNTADAADPEADGDTNATADESETPSETPMEEVIVDDSLNADTNDVEPDTRAGTDTGDTDNADSESEEMEEMDDPDTTADVDPDAADPDATADVDTDAADPDATADVDPDAADPDATADVDPDAADPDTTADVDTDAADPDATADVDPDAADPDATADVDNVETNRDSADVPLQENTAGDPAIAPTDEVPNVNSEAPVESTSQDSIETTDNIETQSAPGSLDSEAETTSVEQAEQTDNADTAELSTSDDGSNDSAVENSQGSETQETQERAAQDTAADESTSEESVDSADDGVVQKESAASEKQSAAAEEEESDASLTREDEDEDVVVEDDPNAPVATPIDRVAYESLVQELPANEAIQVQEEFQLTQLMGSSGLQIYGNIPSTQDISRRLAELSEQTGKKPAFINVSLQKNQLESFVVLPDDATTASAEGSPVASADLKGVNSAQPKDMTIRKTVKDTSRKELIATATQFREEVSSAKNLRDTNYLGSAQELYQVLIEPIAAELEANDIDILVFSMDSGLRLLPLAALHDGEQFLVEKYAMATVPSFGLTDTRYVNIAQSPILAMGASEFSEQAELPTVGLELETIVSNPRQGEAFLNEQFTIPNFVAQNSRETPFPIIHLGTHAEFKAGNLSDSYIQFYDDKLRIPQLQNISTELGWNSEKTPVELLVLSACVTALGDEEAELGFAGLAVQAGVKSALASLWYVSDLGTLALMSEFYDQLDSTLVKAEALRQTQLKMLQGDVMVDDGQVSLSNGQNLALPEEFPGGSLSLEHPYFWSSFTLIGNWN